MAQIISFVCDKQLAAPSGIQGNSSGTPDPHDQRVTIKITLKTLGDNNQADSFPLAIGSDEPANVIQYFDSDFQPIPVDKDSFIHVSTWKDGELFLYLCSTQSVLFSLLAKIDQPGQGFRSLELIFFDFGLPPGDGLPAPQLLQINGQVRIPPWSSFEYSTNVNTPLPMASYKAAAIVCNNYAYTGDPSMIRNDFRVPYGVMSTAGVRSSLAYVLNTGTNTISSPVLTFTASGQGLVMPDPLKEIRYPAPEWEGGNARRLTSWDIYPSLVLNITLVDGVKEGDTYAVNIYLNGYDKTGLCMPRAPVQVYTLTAPANAKPGQQIPCEIDRQHLLGYRRQSPTNWGYLWADCMITSAAQSYTSAWTRPWGPIEIDFFPQG